MVRSRSHDNVESWLRVECKSKGNRKLSSEFLPIPTVNNIGQFTSADAWQTRSSYLLPVALILKPNKLLAVPTGTRYALSEAFYIRSVVSFSFILDIINSPL